MQLITAIYAVALGFQPVDTTGAYWAAVYFAALITLVTGTASILAVRKLARLVKGA